MKIVISQGHIVLFT